MRQARPAPSSTPWALSDGPNARRDLPPLFFVGGVAEPGQGEQLGGRKDGPIVETPDANLSKGMRQLNGVYAQATNRRRGLVGHLFQGRFKAILVERDAYLLELARYLVRNPVRAGMVPEAGGWPWSSYRAMVGAATAPAWLETDWVPGQFGAERSHAQTGYVAFVHQGIARPSVWEGLRHQVFLGTEAFVKRHCAASKRSARLREVPRA